MRWPRRTRHRGDAHIVDRGLVGCPVRGRDVDIDRCLTCPDFEDLAKEDDLQVVLCRPRMPSAEDRYLLVS